MQLQLGVTHAAQPLPVPAPQSRKAGFLVPLGKRRFALLDGQHRQLAILRELRKPKSRQS